MNWFRLRRRMARHHLPLLVLTLVFVAATGSTLQRPEPRLLASMGTGYAALIWMAVTLVLGPFRVLKGRNAPVTFDLRRDTGIWAGGLAMLHVVLGLQVHMRGRVWLYFLPANFPDAVLRTDLFGAANYLGLIAALPLALLLAISNDLAWRRLGPRWKRVQRWNSPIFVLTLAHTIAYLTMEHRPAIWFALTGLLAVVVLAIRTVERLIRSSA